MSKSFGLNEARLNTDMHEKLNKALSAGGILKLYEVAKEEDLLIIPLGLELDFNIQDDKYDVYLMSDIWGNLKIYCGFGLKEEYIIKEPETPGWFSLRNMVDIANKGLEDLIYSSDIVLAQFSRNKTLLESLAGCGDSMVRALIKYNEDSTEEAKVLALLRERNSN